MGRNANLSQFDLSSLNSDLIFKICVANFVKMLHFKHCLHLTFEVNLILDKVELLLCDNQIELVLIFLFGIEDWV